MIVCRSSSNFVIRCESFVSLVQSLQMKNNKTPTSGPNCCNSTESACTDIIDSLEEKRLGAGLPAPKQLGLADKQTAEVSVENLDTAKHVNSHNGRLTADIVCHGNPHRQIVVASNGCTGTEVGVRQS